MREDVVRVLEKAREAIWEEAAAAAQAAGRGMIARKIGALAGAHTKAAANVRLALDDKPPQVVVASAALGVLRAAWEKAGVSASASAVLVEKQRELAELSAEVSSLEAALAEEKAALDELTAAMADGEFVLVKTTWQRAAEASPLKLSVELAAAMSKAEGMLEAEATRLKEAEEKAKLEADAAKAAAAKKELDEHRVKEAEVARQEKERAVLAAQAAKGAMAESAAVDGRVEVSVAVRNDPRPEKGPGFEMSPMNTVTSLTRGGLAAKDGVLLVGDVITAVDGVKVMGKKAVSAMDEKADKYVLTVLRDASARAPGPSGADDGAAGGGGGGERGAAMVDMEGWLTKVKAEQGRMVRYPEKRWVVLQGSTISWYKDSRCANEANSQNIEHAVCTLPKRAANGTGEYVMSPAMKQFAGVHKYPFQLEWPNGQVKHELVFASSTSADRAAWATALRDAIQRAKAGAPSAGWLFKEGGRKNALALAGWKRRWFTLAQGSTELYYYETPTSSTPKGKIQLRNADIFMPKGQIARVKNNYRINFCIASENVGANGKVKEPMCTLLAATNEEERDMWVRVMAASAKPPPTDHLGKGGKSVYDVTNLAAQGDGGAAPTSKATSKAARPALGNDTGAAALDAGAEASLEQLKMCDMDVLLGVRIKKLKEVLVLMGVDHSIAVEKKDLVALIIKNREKSYAGKL